MPTSLRLCWRSWATSIDPARGARPNRQVIFVGDFIDRGPGQIRTMELVRDMIEAGSARATMGNHEFNAVAFDPADQRRAWAERSRGHRVLLSEQFLPDIMDASCERVPRPELVVRNPPTAPFRNVSSPEILDIRVPRSASGHEPSGAIRPIADRGSGAQAGLMNTEVVVTPIFGWGWIEEQGESCETPQPFAVAGITAREGLGSVTSEGHEFSKAQARFSDRYTDPDGVVNVEITSPDSRCLAIGFAQIEHGTGDYEKRLWGKRGAPVFRHRPTLGSASMRRAVRRLSMIFIGCCVATTCLRLPAIAGPLEDGIAAAQRGDDKAAIKSWLPSAEAGNAAAQYEVGVVYSASRPDLRDYSTALSWFRKAADQGFPPAQERLGHMFREGEGIPKDYNAAMSWEIKAASQGYAPAQSSMGWMYENGLGGPQDYMSAVRFYRKAADQGDPSAQYNLGRMYILGRGTQKNLVEAHMWLNLAATRSPTGQGDLREAAVKMRELVERTMSSDDVSEAQRLARDWVSK